MPPRRAIDRERQTLSDIVRAAWRLGLDGQVHIVRSMQATLAAFDHDENPDLEELGDAVAEIRYEAAEGVRLLKEMLEHLNSFQDQLPNGAPAEDD